MLIDDLSTPALLVDDDRLNRNLDRMQAKADANDVALRPHGKTHKSPALARRQIDRGAVGLTVATLPEAEAFAEAGVDDIRIAYPVIGEERYERLLAVAETATVSFTVDTEAGIRQASRFFDDAGATVDVLLEIDVGHGRCGVPWDAEEETIRLAETITDAPGLDLAGILTHAGQAYHGPHNGESKTEALRRAGREERERMLEVAARLDAAGVEGVNPDAFEISIGSTPSLTHFENAERDGFQITEIRPGNYVFNDAMQVDLASAELDDCALSVYTTVVSKRRDPSGTERVYVDAGKKVVTTDQGPGMERYGTVLYNARYMRPHPHAVVTGLSEEHGWMRVPGGATFSVGDRLRIVPNHACVTVATQENLYVTDGDEVTETWSVDA